MKLVLLLALALSAHAQTSIPWTKVWPPGAGTFNPSNGYEDVIWDAYTGKVWIYSTNGTNSGDQIYSIRLHYFDPAVPSDTNIGDNGQTQGAGCFVSIPNTWPATHHTVGQFWVDTIRHRMYTIQGVGCTEELLEEWYYQLLSPISGNVWTEVYPPGLATNHTGEVGPWQSAFQNTTLSASMLSTDATMTLTLPSTGVNQDFYLIDSEIVRITGNGNQFLIGPSPGTGANPLAISRAQYGTTAASHSSGATVERIWGTMNNGKVVHDAFDDAFFWFGLRNDNSFGQLLVYCDTSVNPIPGTLTANQSTVGCKRADDWTDITSKSICAGSGCHASAETGTGGPNSGRLPNGWYYPSLDYDSTSHLILAFAGGISTARFQISYIYTPQTLTWTQLSTTCTGAQCTGLLSANMTSAGTGYTSPPTVTISGCTGATATASLSGTTVSFLIITNMGTACSSPTVGFSGGAGTGAAATATANGNTAPPIYSSNSETTRIAHALYHGKLYYHLSQHMGGENPLYGGPVQDWVLDPIAQTWTEIQAGVGPTLTEAMTVDPATGNLYAWVVPTSGANAEIWLGQLGPTITPSPQIMTGAFAVSGKTIKQ